MRCCLRRKEYASRNKTYSSWHSRFGSRFVSDFRQFCATACSIEFRTDYYPRSILVGSRRYHQTGSEERPPCSGLQREDFRLFDDGSEVPIVSFDSGTRNDTRAFIVWLVLICNEGGKTGGSAEFAGKESYFRPALDHLDKHDAVGVAHWCDNVRPARSYAYRRPRQSHPRAGADDPAYFFPCWRG